MTAAEVALEKLRCKAEGWAVKEAIACAMMMEARGHLIDLEIRIKDGIVCIPQRAYDNAKMMLERCHRELEKCKEKHVEYGEKYHELRRELEAIGRELGS